MNRPFYLSAAFAAATLQADAHDHFAAGIVDSNHNRMPDAGEPLCLIGPDLTGKVFHLLARPVGQSCGGYYMLNDNARTLFPLDSFSFTALSDGQTESGAVNFAHTGSNIWMEITAVVGPAGANFGYWDGDQASAGEAPTVSFPANTATGNFAFEISEPLPWIDAPDQDPYGHIHGRCWTSDRAGDYFVSYRLVDRGNSGPGDGPWHAPSRTYVLHFKAGPEFLPSATLAGGSCVLTWPSQMGIWEPYQTGVAFRVQRNTSLAATGWVTLGTVAGTTAASATFTDTTPPAGRAFYRLSFDWSAR